jgi:glutaredoxin
MAFFNKCNKNWRKRLGKDKSQLSDDFCKFVEATPQEYGFLIQTKNAHTHEDNRKEVHSIDVPTICFDGEDVDEEVAEDTHPMPSLPGLKRDDDYEEENDDESESSSMREEEERSQVRYILDHFNQYYNSNKEDRLTMMNGCKSDSTGD